MLMLNGNATKCANINKDTTEGFMKIYFNFWCGVQLQSFFI
jgi:hypothetical protein